MADNVLRVDRNENFKTINLHAVSDDHDLSAKAVGILTYLVTRPDGWEFYRKDIIQRFSDGRSSIDSGLDELKKAGYLSIERDRQPDGTTRGYEWTIREVPSGHSPDVENPKSGLSKSGESGDVVSRNNSTEKNDSTYSVDEVRNMTNPSEWPSPSNLPKEGGSYVYPEEVEEAWAARWERDGPNPKLRFYRNYRRARQSGMSREEAAVAVKRRKQELRSDDKAGTRFAEQYATFFGEDELWREYAHPPESPNGDGGSMTVAQKLEHQGVEVPRE